MTDLIYKIAAKNDWKAAEAASCYSGAEIDKKDGFIHFSTAAQLHETAAKHFAGEENLLLVAVDPRRLGDALRWEVSRGGDLFPHLYAPLFFNAVVNVTELPLTKDGSHTFPEELA